MPKPIIFYDIPSKLANKAWSPNTWKTRYCLNIKRISYETVWVEFPDIAALCKKIGASPSQIRRDGSPYYSLPVIYDPNTNIAVTDSTAIVQYLDKTYPDTLTLIPKEIVAYHAAFQRAFESVIMTPDLMAIMVPGVHDVLNPASQPYFRVTREKRFGKLEDLAPAGSDKRAKHWAGVKKGYRAVAEWLNGDASGEERLLFLGGDRISYADVSVAALLMWIRAIFGDDSEEWKDVLSWDDGRWARFTDVMKKYESVEGTAAKL